MQWKLFVCVFFLVELSATYDPMNQECTPPLFFKCRNTSKCISHAFVCDGDDDCGDNSDENPELCRRAPCNEREIQCADGFQCVLQNWICDGVKDCLDGSDETNCSTKQAVAPANCNNTIDKYLCANGQRCIDLALVCNNVDDCGDDSDEHPANCARAVESCKSSPCPSKCRPTPRGFQCVCSTGYIFKNDTCTDIDECEEWGLCDQKCMNLLGSYRCQCELGYNLLDDRHTCKPENGEALMIYATKTMIQGYYLDSTVYFSIANNLQYASGISLDANHLYWSDVGLGEEKISRSLRDGSKREVIVSSDLGYPEDIAVDWITGNVYFTDSMYEHIGVCNDNGDYCTVIIDGNIEKLRGIVVMPSRAKMYWSDWGNDPHIAVSFMDGTKRDFFVREKMGWPKGLTIDFLSDRLYWVDAKLKVIESIDLDGVDRRTVLQDVTHQPYSLAIFGNRLYWSDWSSNSIHTCNKFTGKDLTTIIQKNETLYGIHIYHETVNAKYPNPCASKPCSQLCLLAENRSYSCACTVDSELQPDWHTCSDLSMRKQLAIATGNAISKYYLEKLGKPRVTSTVAASHINALTRNPTDDTLIAADEMTHSILQYDPSLHQVNNITTTIDEVIDCISFDHLGNNLYKSSAMYKKIEVQSLATGEKTEFSYLDSPFDIVVVPEEGFMFIVFQSYYYFSIDRAQMNGLGSRTFIVNHLIGPKISLTYDKDTRRVFWADEGIGRIDSSDPTGQNKRSLQTGITSPVSIAVLDTNIFWTSRRSSRLSWTNKNLQAISGIYGLDIEFQQDIDIPLLQATDSVYIGIKHICGTNNGNCSHVCLVTNSYSRLCACPFGVNLDSDKETCKIDRICAFSEMKCSQNNKCISNLKKCDGIKDCPAGEDEQGCVIRSNSDTVKYIKNDDDEYNNIDVGHRCKEGQFTCRTGNCIPIEKVCDGEKNCVDGSDEDKFCKSAVKLEIKESNEKGRPCQSGEIKCSKSDQCIAYNQRCNGVIDCPEGEDEKQCNKLSYRKDRLFINITNSTVYILRSN